MPAVRRYVQAIVRKDEDAEDLAQDLVVRLMAGDFAAADPGRGRFRDLLKTAVRNMARNFWSKKQRQQRRVVDLDVADFDAPDDSSNDDLDEAAWLSVWRRTILDAAWKALKQGQSDNAGYTLLRLRSRYPNATSEELAARLSKKLGQPFRADAVRQRLRRTRLQFADLLITELGRSIDDPTPEKIEEELIALGLLELMRGLLPAGWSTESSQRHG